MNEAPYPWNESIAEIAKLIDGNLRHGGVSGASVSELCVSSSACVPGSCFVAIRGVVADGHNYIGDAVERGAALLVVQHDCFPSLSEVPEGIAVIEVSDTRKALSALAALRFGYPSSALKVVGVTGTNGKTTINWLVFHLLNRLGFSCVRLGTLGLGMPSYHARIGMRTTPDAVQLQGVLRQGLASGCQSAVLEVSSHALAQCRADDVQFDVVAFTNLTRDHLDYHKTMEEYYRAKRKLFELAAQSTKPQPTGVICIDDPYGRQLAKELTREGKLKICTTGFAQDANLRISDMQTVGAGSQLVFSGFGALIHATTDMIGHHNAQNTASAVACVHALGYSLAEICDHLSGIPTVTGRLECLRSQDPAVYVDYAHTPDALEKALTAVRLTTKGNLWVLFGCGGDRDPGKRPIMAEVATSFADKVVLTSDNPRTEDPQKIVNEVLNCSAGERIKSDGIVQVDRTQAIQTVLQAAGRSDSVLIAGKGHEDYQIIGQTKTHFSDHEEVRRFYGEEAGK